MLRRNGKPTSCEPCRLSKVRCDHATPICRRCHSRGIVNQCYYHPAPLTRVRDGGIGRPRAAQHRGAHRQSLLNVHDLSPTPEVANVLPETGSDTKHSQDSEFLGSTSYLSVFKETPRGISGKANRSLYTEFEYWRTEHAYASSRLIRLASAMAFHREQIDWYHRVSRFTVVPAPLILDSLDRVQEYIRRHPWDVTRNWKGLYEQITAATGRPLHVSRDMSPGDFYAQFTGPNLRWEFIALILTSSGISTMVRYPGHHVVELGTGEKMTVEMFMKEMVLASNACIEISKQFGHVNDLILWARYMHVHLAMEVLGDTSERMYSLFGDLISNIYTIGLHHQPLRDVPFFLAETRKRMLAVAHRTDKSLATLMGRPPRLPHQYCDAAPPLDIADEDLFLDSASLNAVLAGLDDQGWHREARFMPATVMRIRHFLSTLREQVLELSLGNKSASDYGERVLKTYHLCQEVSNKIPSRFHYDPLCWNSCDLMESLARILIQFDYQFSVLHLQRIRCKENSDATGDLMDTSLQVLNMVMDLTRNYQSHRVQRQFACIYLAYGIPAAGILVTELHSHTLANRPFPASTPRSEIIRSLSVLIAWVQSTEMPPSATAVAARELTKVISRLLDDALNHQHGASVAVAEQAENPAAGPLVRDADEFLPQGLGEGFHLPSEALGVGLASEEFLSWLDELDLDMISGERFI
ncbi:putative transcription factor [Aspergillus homomorphus CBS 101889]|uniref:Putative fungal-specific transcription factor n=1 Tax=Aspergillus homomorphus (strain CBS 101889) TaxID=1450537 RepID=A0A395I0Z8_ASPHC|nr:putative fungal-specific transcription factor [Aspergillus homomorphus CBS 101889]RAL12828.1 putative fungal-specific transcription factor [Aspergillus homomorphus CBS 101889]